MQINILKTKLYFTAILFFLSCSVYPTQVITPGFILLNITDNYKTVAKLEKHWAISGSEFQLSKNHTRKAYLSKLNLLKNIDPKSINIGTRGHEKTTQIVQTKSGIKLAIRFKYTKHEYNKDALLNFAGDYSLVSVSLLQPIHIVKSIFENPGFVVTGYVVKKYICPKCPTGAVCKPCMSNNIIISEKADLIDSYSFVGDKELILFYKNSEKLILGDKYTFHITSTNKEFQLIDYEEVE